MTIQAPSFADFTVPDSLVATQPPEVRAGRRDAVRLLVADEGGIDHQHFTDLALHLRPGDLVVVNDSATLPAAVDGTLRDGSPVVVHFSTALDDGAWVVELRPFADAHGPVWTMSPGEVVSRAGGVEVALARPYPDADADATRLWRARVGVRDVPRFLGRQGRPIRYWYVPDRWPLACYQTIFARRPGSAEMPSAGRPFTADVVASLRARSIAVAAVTLHTGVSSAESGEPPLPERFAIPARTARVVNRTRREGGRIIATGTTVTRALESGVGPDGEVRSGRRWTDLVLGPQNPARIVDGIITGWHVPGSSHLGLLTSVVGMDVVGAAYAEALACGYLWHEFGDSALLVRER